MVGSAIFIDVFVMASKEKGGISGWKLTVDETLELLLNCAAHRRAAIGEPRYMAGRYEDCWQEVLPVLSVH
jgi:hypothetical protein